MPSLHSAWHSSFLHVLSNSLTNLCCSSLSSRRTTPRRADASYFLSLHMSAVPLLIIIACTFFISLSIRYWKGIGTSQIPASVLLFVRTFTDGAIYIYCTAAFEPSYILWILVNGWNSDEGQPAIGRTFTISLSVCSAFCCLVLPKSLKCCWVFDDASLQTKHWIRTDNQSCLS